MTLPVRVRFAPSPTGHLHIGGARTAIYNWAFARHHDGAFVLRIEDTDPERSTEENTQAIIRAMEFLGLDYDEGPGIGGPYGPYFQTQRADSYRTALERLKSVGAVYPCFCTSDALDAKREAARERGGFAGYDGTCRGIPEDVAAARIRAGEAHVWRLRVPEGRGDITFTDAVRGDVTFSADSVDDYILVRTDGSATYNFAVAIDDITMAITHVIRGDDHLSNTPKQILVYEALGEPVPTFAHLSMIRGADGKRLSKRHGAESVEAYRDAGYLPEALVNYLALLGWSLDGETTVFSRETLAANFSLDRVSRNPAIFDVEKLAWLNGVYIRELSPAEFAERVVPFLAAAGLLSEDEALERREWLEHLAPLVSERVKHLDEVVPAVAFLFAESVEFQPAALDKVLRQQSAGATLVACTSALASLEDFDAVTIEAALRDVPERLGVKPKSVFQVVRVAVSGTTVSPPLFESLELLGRDRTIARLEAARELAED